MGPIQVTWRDKRFVCFCRSSDIHIPRAAGFLWDSRRREWWSREPEIAERLKEYWDVRVRSVFEVIAARRRAIEESRATDAAISIPAPSGLEYLPYQKAGVAFSRTHKNILLADEMGLGKTIQAIGIINLDTTISSVLVVCPASLKTNWKREMGKWLVNDRISIGVASGEYVPQTNIVIINYDILERHRERLSFQTWDLLIVDECHYAKNPKAKRTKALLGGEVRVAVPGGPPQRCRWKAIPASRKVFLTGTPIVNRPVELWPLIHALDPTRWDNWKHYVSRYCGAVENTYGMDTRGGSRLDELQRVLRATIMLRRLKSEVLTDLPPKMHQVIELPATGAMAARIVEEGKVLRANQETIRAIQSAMASADVNKNEAEYRNAVRRLREAMKVDFEALSRVRHETALAKMPLIIEHVQQCLESVDKIVLFAHHKDVIQGFHRAFGSQSVLLFGETSMAARAEAVDRFQSDKKVRVFIGGIIPAGVGITLTAASHVIFAEIDWVPGNMAQAADRCHRIGQRDSVLVQYLVLEGSLDAHIARVIVEKQEVIEKALDVTDEPAPAARCTATPSPRPPAVFVEPFRVGEQGTLF